MGERRANERSLVCAPVGVEPQTSKGHKAVLRDISMTGASFLTRVVLQAEEPVTLTIELDRASQGRSVRASGKVVRVQALDPECADVWTHQIAVHFNEPLSRYEAEIQELADRLVRAGLPW